MGREESVDEITSISWASVDWRLGMRKAEA